MKMKILALLLTVTMLFGTMSGPVIATETAGEPSQIVTENPGDPNVTNPEPTETPETPAKPEPTETPETPETPEPTETPETPPVEIPDSETPGAPEPTESPKEPEVVKDPEATEEPEKPLEQTHPAIKGEHTDEDLGIIVTVEAPIGAFPKGTTLLIEPVKAPDPMVRGILEDKEALANEAVVAAMEEESSSVQSTASYDISFRDENGGELQPANGYFVNVAFAVEGGSDLLTDAEELQVFHIEESNGEMTASPVGDPQPVSKDAEKQEISVDAASFSIYVVTGINVTVEGTTIENGTTYTVTLGTPSNNQHFFRSDKSSDKFASGAKWESSNSAVAEIGEIKRSGKNVGIVVKVAGETTITHTYYTWSGLSQIENKETFTLIVKGVTIENQIPQNGCLVPVLGGIDENDVTIYEWFRDNVPVTGNPLEDPYAVDNGVNVALDRGGVDNSTKAAKTYKVRVTLSDDTALEATYAVPYGNEILNGNFEYPIAAGNQWFANGYEKLFWRTTAPKSGQDVEYISVRSGTLNSVRQQFNTDVAAEGLQFAELNAEAAGTLYQDVLTTPGASLYWSLSHRGRNQPGGGAKPGEEDTMYVVIAAAKDVDGVILNQTDVNTLVSGRTEGYYQITYKTKTFSYYVSRQSHDNTKWYSVGGSYSVPGDQYLTRFFFAAGETAFDRKNPNSSDKYTVGNLIDDISFSEDIAYRIEYYVNGQHLSASDQTGAAAPNSVIAAGNAPDNMALDRAELNGKAYTGGASITLLPNRAHVLSLYYESNGISITKTIAGLEGVAQQERKALLNGYQVKFVLKDANNNAVAEATVTVEASTLSGTAVFKVANTEQTFLPPTGLIYSIEEITAPNISGYKHLGTSFSKEAVTGPADSVTVTNTYQQLPQTGNLTIKKSVDSTPTQSFIFEITGSNNFSMTVAIHPEDFGDGTTASVTIHDLPKGGYTVTERGNWSWQYTPNGRGSANVGVSTTTPLATFTNSRNTTNWLGDSEAVKNIRRGAA